MNLGLDMKLQEDLAEGVIHLSPDGQVTDFNRAAVPWIKYAIVARNPLRQQIEEITRGTLKPPVQIELPDTADQELLHYTIHLCTAGPKGYALFISSKRTQAEVTAQAANDNDFFRLLGSQTRHELTLLREKLSESRQDGAAVGPSLTEQSDRLSRLLIAFDQLSRLHQADAFQSGERLSLWRLVKQLIDESPRDRCSFFITPKVESKSEAQSVIYGDATWLETSIRTLMTAIAETAPPHSKVEMRLSLSGGYIVLSSHFATASGGETRDRPVLLAPGDLALRLDTDIGRQICHRVVEMHGGQLVVTESDRAKNGVAGIDSFSASFALSAPSRAGSSAACSVCPMAMQMEKYAKDLAFLLTRQPVLATTSTQELQMLSKLLTPSLTASTDAPGARLKL